MKNENLEEAISFLEQIYEDKDVVLLQMARVVVETINWYYPHCDRL